MGLGFSQDGQVQQLYQFRKLDHEQQDFEIPEKPENRRQTDRKYWIAFIAVLVVFIPLAIYTLIYMQPNLIYGTDNCGNFCGFANKKYEQWECTGKNYTQYKYIEVLQYDSSFTKRECLKQCPENKEAAIWNLCLTKKPAGADGERYLTFEDLAAILGEIGSDIAKGWWAILLSAIVSTLLCFGMLSLFRYAVDFVVWFILIGSIGIIGIIAGCFWYMYFTYKEGPDSPIRRPGEKDPALGFMLSALVFSILVAILLIVVTCMVKRVKLIIQLFKESSKAIFDIPSLIFVPVWSALLVILAFLVFLALTGCFVLAGQLVEVAPGYLEYMKNGVMVTTIVYNFVIYLWISEFIFGAQYMIIGGAVSAWFFTRNKHYLERPLWASFLNLWNFHMGTVAIGSLILTIMNIIKMIIKGLTRNERTRWLIECCMENIEEFLRFLSKNAYIQTAMHGQPFFRSGKRAAKLLISNASNVIAVNSIGDFVLAIAQTLLLIVCSAVGIWIAKMTGLTHDWALSVICIVIAACLVISFFSIFEATIDCTFICFCEDTTLNDGMARPYFMSKGLMQFIEDSKAVFPRK